MEIMIFFVSKTKKMIVELEIETPKNVWLDELVRLRSKP